MRQDPVVIFALPRSGSSMVARIFHEHGLWVGECKDKYDYPCYENAAISKLIGKHRIVSYASKVEIIRRDHISEMEHLKILADLWNIVPLNTPWMFKTIIDWFDVWRSLFPNMKPVFVYRDLESNIRSRLDQTDNDQKQVAMMRQRDRLLRETVEKHDGPVIYSPDILRGDYTVLRVALEECGLEPSRKIIDRCVEPNRWHHNENGK